MVKRPLPFKLALWWCTFYAVALVMSVLKARGGILASFGAVIPGGLMAWGTFALRRGKRWAPWFCAILLALLTLWLPFGYSIVASSPHAEPNKLLRTFLILASINLAMISVLVIFGYRASVTAVLPSGSQG